MSKLDAFLSLVATPRIVLPLLVLLMAGLTGPHVFGEPLWGDELRTWRDGIEKPLADVLAWRHNPDHAPLGHLLARAGAAVFGVQNAWALRLGSWLCGLACVPAIWWMGRIISGRSSVGLLMALMLVVDPNAEKAATIARMYSVLLLAAIVAIGFAVKLLSRARPDRHLEPIEGSDRSDVRYFASLGMADVGCGIGLALAIGAGIWSHSQIYAALVPMFATAIIALIVAFVRGRGVDRGAATVLIAAVAGMLLGLPGILKLLGRRDADPLDAEAAQRPFAQLEDATQALTGENWITALVMVTAIGGWIVIGRSRNRAVAWLLAGVVVMSLTNLLIAAQYRPVGYARYLTIAQPSLWAGIGTFIAALWTATPRNLLFRSAAVGFVGLCGFQLTRTLGDEPHPNGDQFRQLIATVQEDRHVILVPRSPHEVYGRYYGVRHDDAAFKAVAAFVQTRVTTRRARGDRASATTAQTELIRGNEPITIVGVIPARGAKARTPEDPLELIKAICRERNLLPPSIPTPDGTLRVIVVRFTTNGRIEVDDRYRPQSREAGQD